MPSRAQWSDPSMSLGGIIRSHGLDYDLFADDTQLSIFVRPIQGLVDGAVGRIELCVRDIRIWMRKNFLKLNDSKTELVVMGSSKHVAKVHIPGVVVGDSLTTPSPHVRDLGAVLDSEMTMVQHVNAVCRSVHYQIHNIGRIRRFLTQEACKQIVRASVTSRLYFCNSLLVGLPDSTLGKLQHSQNIAAHIITRTKKYEHKCGKSSTGYLWWRGSISRSWSKSIGLSTDWHLPTWLNSSSCTNPVALCALVLTAICCVNQ